MSESETVYCSRCDRHLSIDQFYPASRARKKGWCKKCANSHRRDYRNGLVTPRTDGTCDGPGCNNSLAGKRQHARFCSPSCTHKTWRAENPGKQREHWYKSAYGVSVEFLDALFESQGNKCAICDCVTTEGRGRGWNVDHCHATGEVRGILCQLCNQGIGQLKDDPKLLRRATEYLENYRDNFKKVQ